MRSGQAPRGRLFRVLATGLGVIVALALAELVLRVGARVSPDVRHLATAGVRRTLPPFKSLAEFLAWNRVAAEAEAAGLVPLVCPAPSG